MQFLLTFTLIQILFSLLDIVRRKRLLYVQCRLSLQECPSDLRT